MTGPISGILLPHKNAGDPSKSNTTFARREAGPFENLGMPVAVLAWEDKLMLATCGITPGPAGA
jgi:hypothetical protein